MSTSKKIKVIVNKKGEVAMEAFGFQGSSCAEATAKFSSLLGKVAGEEKKEEYHQQDENFITE